MLHIYIYDIRSLRVNDVRQIEVHTAEPLVAKPTAFEVEMIVEKFKKI